MLLLATILILEVYMDTLIKSAIETMSVLEFDYEGEPRVVEPHCYGITTAGNEAIRCYQIDGYSSSGKLGWKLYDLSKASDIRTTSKTFSGPREGYKPGDKAMSQIFCEL